MRAAEVAGRMVGKAVKAAAFSVIFWGAFRLICM